MPENDLGQQEKEDLIADHDTSGMDTHAKDALAAAVRAYRAHSDFIHEVRRKTEQAGVRDRFETVLEQSFAGDRSIQQVIDAVQQEETEEDEEQPVHAEQIDWEKTARDYREQLEEKREEIERLRDYQDQLEEERDRAQEAKDELEQERNQQALRDEKVQKWKQRAQNLETQVEKLENQKRSLENRLERYLQALRFVTAGEDVYPICESREDLEQQDDSIAFVRKNLRVEPPEHLRAVIVEKDQDAEFYREHGIKAVDYRDLKGLKLDEFYIVDSDRVLDAIQDNTETFMEWLDEYRERG